jgi:hypothetical protein
MTVRKLHYHDSLDTIWNELVYTRARLEADPDARELGIPLQDIVGRLYALKQNQYKTWEGEVMAQAKVDAVDYALDMTVYDFGYTMDRLVKSNHKDPRWTRYFGTDTVGTIRRQGLQSEITRITNWVDSLKTETDPELKNLGTRFETIVNNARNVLTDREKAITARADYRARDIMTFIDDINAMRLSIYGELTTRTNTTGHHRGWADEFFYHTNRTARNFTPGTNPNPNTDPV